jgi:hypothetical protein
VRLTQFPEGVELYNLRKDPGEAMDVSEDFPQVVETLMEMAGKQITALGQ